MSHDSQTTNFKMDRYLDFEGKRTLTRINVTSTPNEGSYIKHASKSYRVDKVWHQFPDGAAAREIVFVTPASEVSLATKLKDAGDKLMAFIGLGLIWIGRR